MKFTRDISTLKYPSYTKSRVKIYVTAQSGILKDTIYIRYLYRANHIFQNFSVILTFIFIVKICFPTYVPLDFGSHPTLSGSDKCWRVYQTRELPWAAKFLLPMYCIKYLSLYCKKKRSQYTCTESFQKMWHHDWLSIAGYLGNCAKQILEILEILDFGAHLSDPICKLFARSQSFSCSINLSIFPSNFQVGAIFKIIPPEIQ